MDIEDVLIVELRRRGDEPPVTGVSLKSPGPGPQLDLTRDSATRWTAALTELSAGLQQLRVDLSDRPSLRLQLEVAIADGRPRVRVAEPAPLLCELQVDADNRRFTLLVELGPAHHELLFVAGWDYSGGADNRRWCETWRDDLHAGKTWIGGVEASIPKQIHDHTVVTLFDFVTGDRVQQLRGANGWHEADRTRQGAVRPHLGRYRDPANAARRHDDDSISIVHVYDHITALGRVSPGSVACLHIFSHAWAGGPILANTSRSPRYAHSARRDPGDKDGRIGDFTRTNMPELEHFAGAFASDAIAKVWGCYATTLYRRMVRAAARAKDREQTLTIRAANDVRRMTAAAIEAEFSESILGNSYMAQLGRVAGIAVHGAPPGMGANLQRHGRRYYMFVNRRVYALEYRWYAEALGLEPDLSGHFAYTKPSLLA
jgi:hypothetical protein